MTLNIEQPMTRTRKSIPNIQKVQQIEGDNFNTVEII